jgi:hypothetical protein
MAMRTASPWWLSLALGVGLILIFLGERLLGHTGMRELLTFVGVVLVVAATATRGWTTMSTSGGRRRVERTLLLCHLGTVVALVLYALTTNWGLAKLGLSEQAATRFSGAVTVLWAILLVASVVPVLMIELALGVALRTQFDLSGDRVSDDTGVEYYRVRDIGWSGLSIALAAAFLMVTCNVAKHRNVQRDLSYFKTSAPGDSTRRIAQTSADPIRVLLFFPEVNEVKEQVRGYFEVLAAAAPGKLIIEHHDRMLDAELAAKHRVTRDGTIVLVRSKATDGGKDDAGDKKADETSQTLQVDTEIEKARKGASKLRNLDREVNAALMKLVREKRKIYLTVGHGEANDPDSVPPDLKDRIPERRMTVLKRRLGELNYEVKELGLIDLAKDVPDDATVVIMLAPTLPLHAAEWDALGRYLDKGGRLLVALDPTADGSLGPLEQRFGLKFNAHDLTDDKAFLPQRGSPADRRFAITTQFSAHASTTALSRSVDKGLILIDSGALEEVPATGAAPTKTITIRSMESAFLDVNDNFTFDHGIEKRQRWNIAAAVEGPKMKGADGKEQDGWRALVFADVDLFADALVSSMGRAAVVLVGGPLLDDSVRWLGGEEVFAGEIVSEDDKPIKHTKDQDAKWFTLTIVGGPLVVLTLGLVGTWFRRRRVSPNRSTEVKS